MSDTALVDAIVDAVAEATAVVKSGGEGGPESFEQNSDTQTYKCGGAAGVLSGLRMDRSECAEDPNRPPGAPCSSPVVIAAISQYVDEKDDAPSRTATAKGSEAESGSLPSASTSAAEVVRRAARVLNCDSESCVLSRPEFVSFADAKLHIPPRQIAAEKLLKFKVAGPRNSTELLNNFNIDETLQQWARVFPEFFAYPFAMMDFDKTGGPFADLRISDIFAGKVAQPLGPGFPAVKRPHRCAACVVNTDMSSGPGKHWVAVFVDARPKGGLSAGSSHSGAAPWTIEYFNSAGRPPPRPMVEWMERTRADLEKFRAGEFRAANKTESPVTGGDAHFIPPGAQKDEEFNIVKTIVEQSGAITGGAQKDDAQPSVITIPVTNISHQSSQTECGLYALFYIRRRLEGTPYTFFQNTKNIIPDDAMTEFRKFVFRSAS